MRHPMWVVNKHLSPSLLLQVHIINLLQDSKFQHFKPVMDTYIESHFAGALSYRYMMFQAVRGHSSTLSVKYLNKYCTVKRYRRQHERPTKVSAERQLHSALCIDLVRKPLWIKRLWCPLADEKWIMKCCCLPLPLFLLSIISIHIHIFTTSCSHQMSSSHFV